MTLSTRDRLEVIGLNKTMQPPFYCRIIML
jgi:hypothetical protein